MRKRLFTMLAAATSAILIAAACGGDDDEEATSTPEPTAAPTAEPTEADEEEEDHETSDIMFEAASATITVDGDDSDWADIEAVTVPLEQIDVDKIPPAQVTDLEIDIGPLDPIDVTLKVASDDANMYVLMEVPDTYDFNPDDAHLSASVAVMFRMDEPATPHMGAEEDDLEASLGVVDIWHWELDCGPGEMSGGGTGGGDDPECNFDDEYAPNPEDREDDGGGEVANPTAENSLAGVWTHTAAAVGGDGAWIFEMSRPLDTGDTNDAQFASGQTAHMALAYFDPSETPEGWTDAGHLQSAESGWIEVALP